METNKLKIIKSVLFCITLVLCVCVLNFILVPFSSLMKKFVNYHNVQEKGNIDYLVIGSSLEGDGLNQDLISQEMNGNALVFAPQGSNPEVEYLLLLDVLQKNNVKTAVFGWDLFQNLMNPYYKYPRSEQLNRELIKECWNSSELTKIMLNRYAEQRYSQSFFQFCSFQDNIKDVKGVLKSKYEHWKHPEILKLVSDGQPIDVNNIHKKSFNYDKLLEDEYTDVVNPEDFEYVKKIKALCEKNNINLYFLTAPAPKVIIDAVPIYYSMFENSRKAFDELGIKFINTLDEKYFPNSTENTNFKDCFGHIIPPYRDVYTKAICDYIKNDEAK